MYMRRGTVHGYWAPQHISQCNKNCLAKSRDRIRENSGKNWEEQKLSGLAGIWAWVCGSGKRTKSVSPPPPPNEQAPDAYMDVTFVVLGSLHDGFASSSNKIGQRLKEFVLLV